MDHGGNRFTILYFVAIKLKQTYSVVSNMLNCSIPYWAFQYIIAANPKITMLNIPCLDLNNSCVYQPDRNECDSNPCEYDETVQMAGIATHACVHLATQG